MYFKWLLWVKIYKSHINKFHSVQCCSSHRKPGAFPFTLASLSWLRVLWMGVFFPLFLNQVQDAIIITERAMTIRVWLGGSGRTLVVEGRGRQHLLQECRSAEKIYINISIFCNKSVRAMWRRRENDEKLRELLVVNINYGHRRKMACGWEGKCNLASEHEAWRVLCRLSIWKCWRNG